MNSATLTLKVAPSLWWRAEIRCNVDTGQPEHYAIIEYNGPSCRPEEECGDYSGETLDEMLAGLGAQNRYCSSSFLDWFKASEHLLVVMGQS